MRMTVVGHKKQQNWQKTWVNFNAPSIGNDG